MIQLENKQQLNVQEVAVLTETSVQTIGAWYKWKETEPDNEYAKLLPDYMRGGRNGNTRLWSRDAIEQLIQFKNSIPQGRKGIMGKVTQKYVKKNKSSQ